MPQTEISDEEIKRQHRAFTDWLALEGPAPEFTVTKWLRQAWFAGYKAAEQQQAERIQDLQRNETLALDLAEALGRQVMALKDKYEAD